MLDLCLSWKVRCVLLDALRVLLNGHSALSVHALRCSHDSVLLYGLSVVLACS